jgi:hypothetical protein
MHSSCGRFVIVYNGEVYNFETLKKKLPQFPWKTNGDTEVVLELFVQFGVESFSWLNGIFAFSIYIVFIYILPRLKASLHPGNGGNPGFNIYEQDNTMRLFFYPAVIGWILIGMWLMQLRSQIDLKISKKNLEQ